MNQLWPDHPIRVLMDEHQIILDNLRSLESCLPQLKLGDNPQVHQTAQRVAANLLQAEAHHQREELSLFPELDDVGLDGPCILMCEDHVILRELKHRLQKLVCEQVVSPELFTLVPELAGRLRDHIEREDTVLFPEALDSLDGDAWDRIAQRCAEIGGCDFQRLAP